MPTELHNVSIGFILLEFLKYYAELDVKKFAIACSTPGNPNSRLNTYPAMEVESAVSNNYSINLYYPQIDIRHCKNLSYHY